MLQVYRIVLFLHVLGGAAGLATLLVPLLARKGGAAHRRAGWVFIAGMSIAGLTGLLISAGWLLAPLELKPLAQGADLARHLRRVRENGVFLGTIAILTLNALWQGVRAFVRKARPEPAPARLDAALPAALALAGLVLGGVALSSGRGLLLVFALVSVGTAAGDLRFTFTPLPSPMAWWYQHMRAMMVAVIGALTAFLTFNLPRVVDLGPLSWLPWILPSLLVVPLFQLWIGRYRRRFEGRRSSPAALQGDSVAT